MLLNILLLDERMKRWNPYKPVILHCAGIKSVIATDYCKLQIICCRSEGILKGKSFMSL